MCQSRTETKYKNNETATTVDHVRLSITFAKLDAVAIGPFNFEHVDERWGESVASRSAEMIRAVLTIWSGTRRLKPPIIDNAYRSAEALRYPTPPRPTPTRRPYCKRSAAPTPSHITMRTLGDSGL